MRFVTRKPYVVILHGLDFDLARRSAWKCWLTRRVLAGVAIVVNSHALAEDVRVFLGLRAAPIHVVHPCVHDAFVEASSLLAKSPSATGALTLLTVARLVERKGHLKIIRLLPQLPGVRYRIVGDGPMRNPILNLAHNLGVADRVEILQAVPDGKLPEVYRQADIFVMPTTKTEIDREGFGIVYLEAQLFGVPVVATRSAGVDEAVEDGKTGLLVDDTPEALAVAVARLLDDADLRHRLGEAGRKRVLGGFTREHVMRKLGPVL